MSDEAVRLAERLGYELTASSLLQQGLSHRSWCAEQGGAPSNERLEFLGDAVLGLVVAEYCFRRFPEMPEGELAKVRAAVVNARVLAEVADELDIGGALLLGKGEEASGGRTKPSILADALEAVIGALYLEAGWTAAEQMILDFLGPRIERAAAEPDDFDQKGLLQELTVRQGVGVPRYVVVGSGPDHDRQFEAVVLVNGIQRGAGIGGTKKDAEQEAARQALSELRRA
ncbi:MAG: ribonuclease III [Acidimicrobiales bacterium]